MRGIDAPFHFPISECSLYGYLTLCLYQKPPHCLCCFPFTFSLISLPSYRAARLYTVLRRVVLGLC